MKTPNSLNDKSFAVFGGRGQWGSQIVQALRRNARKVEIIEIDTIDRERKRILNKCDVAFLAVPDTKMWEVLFRDFATISNSIIIDCATNKSRFAGTLKSLAERETVSVCSTHPMVKPGTSTRGQNALIMPVGTDSQEATEVAEAIFRVLEMETHNVDFNKHEEIMMVVQFIAHAIQRVLISVMSEALGELDISIEDCEPFASANFLLSESAMGRVAIQRPLVSAGIIADGLKTEFGRNMLLHAKENLSFLLEDTKDIRQLETVFEDEVSTLDASGRWRENMLKKTDISIERLGNLKANSFSISSKKDKPGVMSAICAVLEKFNINMTALDSHRIQESDGSHSVRFDIGIDEEGIDWPTMQSEFETLGFTIDFSS